MILAYPAPIEFVSTGNLGLQKKWHRMQFLYDARDTSYLINFIVPVPAVQAQDV